MSPRLAFEIMSVEFESSYWRIRNWIVRTWIPLILAFLGDLAILLGLASNSAKALKQQEIQKMRKRRAPSVWDGITHAYNVNTLQTVGWIRRINVPCIGPYLISSGILNFGLQTAIYDTNVFYEHSLDNRLHIVTTEEYTNIKKFVINRIRTVFYAHIATFSSNTSDTSDASCASNNSEIYRSGDISPFINQRIWTLCHNGISARNLAASAAIHGLVDRNKIGCILKNQDDIGDQDQARDKDLRIVVMLDDLSEHVFRIGDLVHF